MTKEQQPYLPGFKPKDTLLLPPIEIEKVETCSVGTTFLTPRAIDAMVALSLPVAQRFISEIELGCGDGGATERIIEDIIGGFPQEGKPIVDLVGLDKQIELFRYAAKKAESISRIELLGADARSLPFPDKSRDFALAAGLLTQNVENADVQAIIKEAVRVGKIVAICDFEILDSRKTYQQEIISPERLEAYHKRYKVTAEALNVPLGTIISTVLPDSNLALEEELRKLEAREDVEGLQRFCRRNQGELRLARHFEPEVLESWLISAGSQIAYLERGVKYLSPSGNPLSGLILIGYSPLAF